MASMFNSVVAMVDHCIQKTIKKRKKKSQNKQWTKHSKIKKAGAI